MSQPLRIGVVGAGAIGCYVGGRLLAAGTAEVVFVGRARLRDELAAHGLTVKDFDAGGASVPAARIVFATEVAALAACDAVLCCVKSAQSAEVAQQLDEVLRPDAVVASLQNGVRNAEVLRAHLGGRRVLAGIVTFNVVPRGGGLFQRATSGPIMLEASDDPRAAALVRALGAALEVTTPADLAAEQWTKLVINLNNAVSALSGAPTRELLLSPGFRRVIAALADEAVQVLGAAGIRLARLRGIPVRYMPFVLRLPTPMVRLVTRAQMRVDPEARSSMWEDLTRGRPTEVDYLNGEIVRIAERARVPAPLNRRIVELVHAAERAGPGSPQLGAAELWTKLSA
jgi:2-dehydropantoate 2-reductase